MEEKYVDDVRFMDEFDRNKELGSQFLELGESWLKRQGHQVVYTSSRPKSCGFYEKLHYFPMGFDDPEGYEQDSPDIADFP
jgi:hypothetical protein